MHNAADARNPLHSDHQHTRDESRGHDHPHSHGHSHHHTDPFRLSSRRDFLRVLMGGALAGVSVIELAYHRAAWARAASPDSDIKLFDFEKVADGVYLAQARPQSMINANSAIFVGSKDVVVVDSHSKPSAAASLIRQIKREITEKPVRYVVNSHFHWDHTQGNHAYRVAEEKIDFIATGATKQLMSDLAVSRVKASLEEAAAKIDQLRSRASASTSSQEKAFCAEQIAQLESYRAELQNYTLELPTITFDQSYVIQDKAHDLHIRFHGHAHTAGDLTVFCPQKRAVATGDVIHGFLPFVADGFPKAWPGTIDLIGHQEFDHILPGHTSLQTGRVVMLSIRNYIEELTGRVEEGKNAGKSVVELQKTIPVASLKSLQSNGYGDLLMRNNERFNPHFGSMPPLQDGVNTNILDIYKNLDR
jgi:cyclase